MTLYRLIYPPAILVGRAQAHCARLWNHERSILHLMAWCVLRPLYVALYVTMVRLAG